MAIGMGSNFHTRLLHFLDLLGIHINITANFAIDNGKGALSAIFFKQGKGLGIIIGIAIIKAQSNIFIHGLTTAKALSQLRYRNHLVTLRLHIL